MTPTILVHRLLSMLVALILLLGGALAIVEIVLAQLDRPYWLVPHEAWSSWVARQTWDRGIVQAILCGLVLVGLLLIVPALRPGKPHALKVPSQTEGVNVTVLRRGAERTLAAAARQADGVSAASASAGRRSVTVKASTVLRSPGDLRERAMAHINERLSELGLADSVQAKLKLSGKKVR